MDMPRRRRHWLVLWWIWAPLAGLIAIAVVALLPRVAHEVKVAEAYEGSLSLPIACAGLVETDSSDLAFQGSGRLLGLYVAEGDRVKNLQLLARLSPSASLPGAPPGDDVIHAPFAGTVVDIYLRAGSVVSAQQPVLRLVSDRAPWVTVFMDSEDAASVRPGHQLRCRAGGYLSEAWELEVKAVGREAVRRPDLPGSARQVRVRCEALGPPLGLAPGTEVDVDGEVPIVDYGVLIPTAAVVHDGPYDRVWVMENERVRRQDVRLGPNNFDLIQIRDGVAAGEQVVVNGKEGLEEGRKVKPEPMPPAREAPAQDAPSEGKEGA